MKLKDIETAIDNGIQLYWMNTPCTVYSVGKRGLWVRYWGHGLKENEIVRRHASRHDIYLKPLGVLNVTKEVNKG